MLSVFNNLTLLQKSLLTSILAVVSFITFAGASYSFFSKTAGTGISSDLTTSLPKADGIFVEDPKEPKTASCPLNGEMHTKKVGDLWDAKLPLAVMIENHTEARPQSGLSSADVVYEAVAEGGITRFMAFFLCNPSDVQVGPVRSARTYFLDWLSEYNALYAHVGGANSPGPANALGQIIKYGIMDLNQFGIGFPTFWRDYQRLGHPVATEHTMYSTTQKLLAAGAKRGWTVTLEDGKKWTDEFISWKFKDDAPGKPQQGSGITLADKINVEFWQGYSGYGVTWNYDVTCNCYKRLNGGAPHLDLDNNHQLAAKNVVVQFERESRANDGYEGNVHLIYKTIGEGKALFFIDGKAIEGKWSKASRVARTKYTDSKGQEIAFDRGRIWIQTVPEGSNVSY
ncbi:MAG: DUF3048 domain-containing protein [bacterium]|nr:DUF3048 domain-containing protein [bacterium]